MCQIYTFNFQVYFFDVQLHISCWHLDFVAVRRKTTCYVLYISSGCRVIQEDGIYCATLCDLAVFLSISLAQTIDHKSRKAGTYYSAVGTLLWTSQVSDCAQERVNSFLVRIYGCQVFRLEHTFSTVSLAIKILHWNCSLWVAFPVTEIDKELNILPWRQLTQIGWRKWQRKILCSASVPSPRTHKNQQTICACCWNCSGLPIHLGDIAVNPVQKHKDLMQCRGIEQQNFTHFGWNYFFEGWTLRNIHKFSSFQQLCGFKKQCRGLTILQETSGIFENLPFLLQ